MTAPRAFFLQGDPGTGQRYALYHEPQGRCRALVLYLHPFAEEMNKSRRMAALQARELAAAGFAVLQPDLRGCGDSSGDFGDAGWDDWLADGALALAWLRQRHGDGLPVWLWGLRAGCLLAAELAQRQALASHFLFWHPPAQGRLLLQQFLRLKAAASLLDGGGKGIVEQLKQELAAGRAVEVAGYGLSPRLSRGLDAAQLQPPDAAAQARHLIWVEQARGTPPALPPVSVTCQQRWREAGFLVEQATPEGPAFWQTSEIEDAPAWLAASTSALLRASAQVESQA